jgi:F0F1-type ATP synthase gamma subunit
MAYVTSCLRHCLAESAVSEESARMAAMDSATNNADDIIR